MSKKKAKIRGTTEQIYLETTAGDYDIIIGNQEKEVRLIAAIDCSWGEGDHIELNNTAAINIPKQDLPRLIKILNKMKGD